MLIILIACEMDFMYFHHMIPIKQKYYMKRWKETGEKGEQTNTKRS